jgi:phenylalanyl-tRNA synthetase beta chain
MEYFARFSEPVRIFELGHTFYSDDGQPLEQAMLSFGFTARALDEPAWRDTHFLSLKADAEALMHALTGRRDFEYAPDVRNGAHPGKTAAMLLDGREVAIVCQVDPRMQAAFDVQLPAYGCWIYLERVPEYRWPLYHAPSKYPSTYRDLALVCGVDTAAAVVEKTIARSIGSLCTGVRTFDEYYGAQVPADKKSLAVRVTLQRMDTTITDEEADTAIEKALKALSDELGATLRL